jgi:hypothetical protein
MGGLPFPVYSDKKTVEWPVQTSHSGQHQGLHKYSRRGFLLNRHVVVFLLAPLTVPLVMSAVALQILREVPSLYWFGLQIAAVVSYAGALLVGAPVYMTLRSRGWSAFWIAPVVGFMVGVIVWIGLVAVVPAVLQSGVLSHVLETLPGLGEVIIAPNAQIWSTSVDGPRWH